MQSSKNKTRKLFIVFLYRNHKLYNKLTPNRTMDALHIRIFFFTYFTFAFCRALSAETVGT